MVVDTMLLPHGDRLRTAVELPLNRAVRPAFVEQEGDLRATARSPELRMIRPVPEPSAPVRGYARGHEGLVVLPFEMLQIDIDQSQNDTNVSCRRDIRAGKKPRNRPQGYVLVHRVALEEKGSIHAVPHPPTPSMDLNPNTPYPDDDSARPCSDGDGLRPEIDHDSQVLPEVPSAGEINTPGYDDSHNYRAFPSLASTRGWSLLEQLGGRRAPRPFAFPSLGTLDTAVEQALAHAKETDGLQSSTVAWMGKGYRALRGYLVATQAERHFLGGQPDTQVRILEGWIAWMRQHELGRVAINGNWRAVRSALRRVSEMTRSSNPLDYCRTPAPGKSQPTWLSRPEAERVLSWVRHAPWRTPLERTRNLLIVGLMLLAGLRRGEVVRLKYGDVNLDQKVIHVEKGKGRHGGKDRPAYMPPQLRHMVSDYLRERDQAGWTKPPLLVSTRRMAPLGVTGIERLFLRISRESGVRVHPHCLRHTYVTLCTHLGIPSRVIQLLSGHESLAMVEHYSHVFSREAQDAAERIVVDFE